MDTPHNPAGVALIDATHLDRPQVIGAYLLLGDEPAIVDPGPASTLPAVEAGLAANGLGLADIRHLLLTHIHLDHAGATGAILARHPEIQVHVHQRGAPHLIDPSRLIASATQLYGDRMGVLWGRIVPAAVDTIRTLSGGETLRLGGRTLRVFDAPGHAKHHVIYLDQASGTAFIGDNGGVRLPELRLTRPATPPPDIDLEAWSGTLDTIAGLRPTSLALTHFGSFDDVTFHLEDYRERLMRWGELVRAGLESGQSEDEQVAALERAAVAETEALSAAERAALAQQTGPLALSWRGLARYWRKRAELSGR